MILGFTGSREGMSLLQKEQFVLELFNLGITEFHHGDCIGADSDAHDIVKEFFPSVKIIIHPPDSNVHRAFKVGDEIRESWPYLVRNHHIVDESNTVIGSPLQDAEVWKSGTWATIRYARAKSKLHTVLKR